MNHTSEKLEEQERERGKEETREGNGTEWLQV